MATEKKTESLKDQIMKASEIHLEPVTAFGRTVHVKRLPSGEYAQLERRLLKLGDDAGGTDVMINLVAATLCDDHGDRIFSDTEIDDLAELDRLELLKVNKVAERLNRITEEQVKETAKN